jgi:hypothetical protein
MGRPGNSPFHLHERKPYSQTAADCKAGLQSDQCKTHAEKGDYHYMSPDVECRLMTWEQRFWARRKTAMGCWVWDGAIDSAGYARTGIAAWNGCEWTRSQYVHIIAWCLTHRRAVPQGYEIHHVCRTRCCFNPAHLELVTLAENRARRVYVPKRVCPHGHKRRPSRQTGVWYCPTCTREATLRWQNRG